MKPGWFAKLAVKGILLQVVIGVFVFSLAGTTAYWQGWLFIVLCLAMYVFKVVLFSRKPELVAERIKPGPGTKWWDRLFHAVGGVLYLGLVVFGALQAGRGLWGGSLHWGWSALGALLMIVAEAAIDWAMWNNPFFSSVVRIQKDRGQRVVSSGPYGIVRHPGYSGAMLLLPGMALVLGSGLAIWFAAAAMLNLAVRTRLEDSTLARELEGYGDYMQKVRYRLVPGVW